MTTDVQREYERIVALLEKPDFSADDRLALATQLDEELGLAAIALRLWLALPADQAFSRQPSMFMAKPAGTNLSVSGEEHLQWTWGDEHFMLYAAPLQAPGTSMLALFIDDQSPVLEVFIQHEPGDRRSVVHNEIYAVQPGAWIDNLMSYYGAYCRTRAVSEAAREKYRSAMEGFWKLAGI